MVNIFKWLGGVLAKAFKAAKDNGLTDMVMGFALDYVKAQALLAVSNDQKRDTVVKLLVSKGIPESIARMATEAAVQIIKKEASK